MDNDIGIINVGLVDPPDILKAKNGGCYGYQVGDY